MKQCSCEGRETICFLRSFIVLPNIRKWPGGGGKEGESFAKIEGQWSQLTKIFEPAVWFGHFRCLSFWSVNRCSDVYNSRIIGFCKLCVYVLDVKGFLTVLNLLVYQLINCLSRRWWLTATACKSGAPFRTSWIIDLHVH